MEWRQASVEYEGEELASQTKDYLREARPKPRVWNQVIPQRSPTRACSCKPAEEKLRHAEASVI